MTVTVATTRIHNLFVGHTLPTGSVPVTCHVLHDTHLSTLKKFLITEIPSCYICPDELQKRVNDTSIPAHEIIANKLPNPGSVMSGDFGEILTLFYLHSSSTFELNPIKKWRFKQDRLKAAPHSDVVLMHQANPDVPSKDDFVICAEAKAKATPSNDYAPIESSLDGYERDKIGRLARTLHRWLGGRPDALAISSYKPVVVDYAVIRNQWAKAWKLDFNTIYPRPRSYFLANFLTEDDFRFQNRQTKKSNILPFRKSTGGLACAATLKARKNGPVALFTTEKGRNGVAGLASKLLAMITAGVSVADATYAVTPHNLKLQEYLQFQLGSNSSIYVLSRHGIGVHHGSLPQDLRREMEEGIQSGAVDVIICTTTLAEGVPLHFSSAIQNRSSRLYASCF